MLVFEERGKTGVPGEKTSRSRVENQQTQPTYDAESENRTRDTLVEGERSHHSANPAPPFFSRPHMRKRNWSSTCLCLFPRAALALYNAWILSLKIWWQRMSATKHNFTILALVALVPEFDAILAGKCLFCEFPTRNLPGFLMSPALCSPRH